MKLKLIFPCLIFLKKNTLYTVEVKMAQVVLHWLNVFMFSIGHSLFVRELLSLINIII